jgi:hypothetical protein
MFLPPSKVNLLVTCQIYHRNCHLKPSASVPIQTSSEMHKWHNGQWKFIECQANCMYALPPPPDPDQWGYWQPICITWSRSSSVSQYTKILAERPGSILGRDNEGIFSLRHRVQTGSGSHPPSCPMGTGGAFPPEVKRPGREANHSPPSSAKIKNEWSYISIPTYVFMVWCLVRYRIRYGVVLS